MVDLPQGCGVVQYYMQPEMKTNCSQTAMLSWQPRLSLGIISVVAGQPLFLPLSRERSCFERNNVAMQMLHLTVHNLNRKYPSAT